MILALPGAQLCVDQTRSSVQEEKTWMAAQCQIGACEMTLFLTRLMRDVLLSVPRYALKGLRIAGEVWTLMDAQCQIFACPPLNSLQILALPGVPLCVDPTRCCVQEEKTWMAARCQIGACGLMRDVLPSVPRHALKGLRIVGEV